MWTRPPAQDAPAAVVAAESAGDYEKAALAAITYANSVEPHSLPGPAELMAQAQVYATLHLAKQTEKHAQMLTKTSAPDREMRP